MFNYFKKFNHFSLGTRVSTALAQYLIVTQDNFIRVTADNYIRIRK